MPINWDFIIVVAFVVGLLLFGIGTSILRSSREPAAVAVPLRGKAVSWPLLVDDSLTETDPQLRLDIVERLSLVGEPWCAEILGQALNEEDDPGVKAAISGALSSMR